LAGRPQVLLGLGANTFKNNNTRMIKVTTPPSPWSQFMSSTATDKNVIEVPPSHEPPPPSAYFVSKALH
jgi:hypothetical protein